MPSNSPQPTPRKHDDDSRTDDGRPARMRKNTPSPAATAETEALTPTTPSSLSTPLSPISTNPRTAPVRDIALQDGYLGDTSMASPWEDEWKSRALFPDDEARLRSSSFTVFSSDSLPPPIPSREDFQSTSRNNSLSSVPTSSRRRSRSSLRRVQSNSVEGDQWSSGTLGIAERRRTHSRTMSQTSFISEEEACKMVDMTPASSSSDQSSPDSSPGPSRDAPKSHRRKSSPTAADMEFMPYQVKLAYRLGRLRTNKLVLILCMVGVLSLGLTVLTNRAVFSYRSDSVMNAEELEEAISRYEQTHSVRIRRPNIQAQGGLRGKLVKKAGKQKEQPEKRRSVDKEVHHSSSESPPPRSKKKDEAKKSEEPPKKDEKKQKTATDKKPEATKMVKKIDAPKPDKTMKAEPKENPKPEEKQEESMKSSEESVKASEESVKSSVASVKASVASVKSSEESVKASVEPVKSSEESVKSSEESVTSSSWQSEQSAVSQSPLVVARPGHKLRVKQAFDAIDESMFNTAENREGSHHPRIISLHEPLTSKTVARMRPVDFYPSDFTDNTQLYSVLDSSDERLAHMEIRAPYSNGECVPMQEWQTTYHPSCNGMHEIALEHMGGDEEGDLHLFGTKGYWRNAWKVDMLSGHHHEYDRETVVLKTLKFQHNFEDAHFEHDRIDAVAMERLTSSPHVINVFGFCGHSVISEYADGSRVGELADKSKKTPLARLQIARDIANGLADVHGIDGDGNATFVHLDINPANVVSIGGTLKLNDFNIGIIRQWNTTSQTPCGFPAQYPNPQWRSPEEARDEQNLTEKVDIFSMGHIFFRLICGHEPWNKLERDGKPSKEEINLKVQKGVLPFIPEDIMSTDDKEVAAIRDAMLRCYAFDPKDRPSAREISTTLQQTLSQLSAQQTAR